MKRFLFFLAAVGCASSLSAASLVLFNTGVDGSGNVLPSATGSVDTHYTVTSDTNSTPHQAVTYNCCYFSNGPNSAWISTNTSGTDGSTFYDYQTTFDIGASFDPSTANITGQFAADNHITATKINGVTVPGATTDTFFSYTSFSITSGFVSGTNTIDFIVKDDGQPSSLRVDSLQGTVSEAITGTPEPASITLFAAGAALVAFGRRAFRKKS